MKVIAEVGVGKTLLCRRLLNALDDSYVSCYIPNPDLSPDSLKKALAIELGIELSDHIDPYVLLSQINEKLLAFHEDDKQVVLVVDEAQALSLESLETIRLLTNLETESAKLMQIILFGQPELDQKIQRQELRQLQQRIVFSQHITPMNESDVELYIATRLLAAGHTTGVLFSKEATSYLYKKSQGVPRLLNMLCHKALMAAYGEDDAKVRLPAAKRAFNDSQYAVSTVNQQRHRDVSAIYMQLKSQLMRMLGLLIAIAAAFSSVTYVIFHYAIR